MHGRNLEVLDTLEPPYLILSNHFNTFDPFIISYFHMKNIHWVASDALFRNRFLRFLLKRMVGSISKSKSKSDFYTIRQIAEVTRNKGVVGIFPEGQRSWDGQTLPLMYATAKLVKMLRVPIVFCILEGGYHSLPRWSKKRRVGQLTVAFQDPWFPESFLKLTIDEIYKEMTKRLNHNDYDYQKKHWIEFKSRRKAEFLEHVLYICPKCSSMASLISRRNIYQCSQCGFKVEVDPYGFFHMEEDFSIKLHTVLDWNMWQREYLKQQFSVQRWSAEEVVFSDSGVDHYTGYRDQKMVYQGKTWIGMTPSGFHIKNAQGSQWFLFHQIDSMAVALQRNMEFYVQETLHRFRFPKPRASAYKYLSAYECLTEAADWEIEKVSNQL